MPAKPFVKKDFRTIVADLLEGSAEGVGGRPSLSDATAGSVVRTLMEAFARELAVCYEQLDHVWRAGFLETAEGQALDNVVALLGLERQRAGYLVGAVEFSRRQPAEADIVIPARTLIAGRGVPSAETLHDARLVGGERVVRVEVQSVAPSDKGEPVPPGVLTLMPRPIAGIEVVINSLALVPRNRPEGDADLRARARNAVRSARTGTKASLETAVRACGVDEVRVMDSSEDSTATPATVAIIIGDAVVDETTLEAVYAAVQEVRPAGIRVSVNRATPISVRVSAVLQLTRPATPAEQTDILARARADLAAYVGQLGIGEPLRAGKLRAVLAADDRVAEAAAGTEPDDPPLMDAMIGQRSISPEALLRNGDLLVSASQRAVLDTTGPWPQLSLSTPGLRIDVQLMLAEAAITRRDQIEPLAAKVLLELSKDLRAERLQANQSDDTRRVVIGFARLSAAMQAVGAAGALFTIVHERDGRVAVLAADGDTDEVAPGDMVRAGSVSSIIMPKPRS